jgi:hypothetical protein
MSRHTTRRHDRSKPNCKTGIPLRNPQTSLNELDETILVCFSVAFDYLLRLRFISAHAAGPRNEKLENELGGFIIARIIVLLCFFGSHVARDRPFLSLSISVSNGAVFISWVGVYHCVWWHCFMHDGEEYCFFLGIVFWWMGWVERL